MYLKKLLPTSRSGHRIFKKRPLKFFVQQLCAVFLIFLLGMSSLVSLVTAGSSPWTQTDWSGGSGQTAWSTTNKFSASSSVDTTSTPGQLTLTNSEKLTNTGFETDLSGWNGTATGNFNDSTYLANANAVASWPLDDTTSTQSYSRVLNPAVSTGRNIVIDGDMETSGTSNWTPQASATLSKDSSSPHGGTQALKITRNGSGNVFATQIVFTTGKAYHITGFVKSDGNSTPIVGTSLTNFFTGTTSTSWQSFNVTFIADATNIKLGITTPVDGQYGEFDDISVTQVNIPASTATPSTIITDGTMEAADTSAWTAGNSATLSKQTGTPHGGSQVLRIARNSVSTPYAKQTVLVSGSVYRVYGYMRSDGSATPVVRQNGMGTNLVTGGTSTAWQPFDAVFIANSTDIDFGSTTNTGTQYVEFDDVTISLDTGIRSDSIMSTLDGDMEQSGTSYWVKFGNNPTISKVSSSPHSGTQDIQITQSFTGSGTSKISPQGATTVQGKTYRITGWAHGDGTVFPRLYDSTATFVLWTGTTSSSWQFFDVTVIATGSNFLLATANLTTGGLGNSTEWDDLTLNEIDPLSGLPTNGVLVGQSAGGHMTNAYSFDGTNDNVNIYSTDLNSAFNPNEGTAIVWAKVSASGVWSDATGRRLLFIGDQATGINSVQIHRVGATNGGLEFDYGAGGSTSLVTYTTSSPTGWFQVVITWSKSNDQVKAYFNGNQVGSTQNGLGTWAANLGSTIVAIGASGSSGSSSWKGLINDVRLYNTALSASQISSLYSGMTMTRDTSVSHGGSASAKLVTANDYSNSSFTQNVNVGDTNQYNLVAYAYIDGTTAVDSSTAQLYYNGATVSTSYASVGGGWYKLTGSVTGVASSVSAGGAGGGRENPVCGRL